MKAMISVAAVALSAVTVFAHPMDDAKVWIRGADDKNGDGWVKTSRSNQDTQDFPNSLKGGVSADPSHVWSARGPATNIHVVAGTVENPLAQTANAASYLHFDQPVWSDGGATKSVYGGLVRTDLPAVTNADPRTVYVRFRLDSFMEPSTCVNLLAMGHSAGSGKGAGWKLELVPDNGGESFHFKVINGRPASTADETGVGTRELTKCSENPIYKLSTNVWVDVVFSCGMDDKGEYFVDVYSCAVGGVFCGDKESIGWNSTAQETSKSYNSYYWLAAAGSDYNPSTVMSAFRGDIAAYAYWDRRLSEDEAYSVMAEPRNDVFALGVKNGSADEFAGSAGAVVDASEALSFASVPSALASGESFTVSFTLDEKSGLGLSQAVRLSGTDASAAATFSIVPNDKEDQAQTLQVLAGQTGVAVFRAKVFQNGVNVLRVTRTDEGAAAFELDALALGGSWSIGRRDDSHGEFAYQSAADSARYTRTVDANWKHTVINLANSGNYAVNRLYAWIDPSVATTRKCRFVARLCAKRDDKLPRVPMSAELRVNDGTAKAIRLTTSDYDGYRDFAFTFESGELLPGVNCFELTNTTGAPADGGSEGYISFDCRQFSVLPDPIGMAILLR